MTAPSLSVEFAVFAGILIVCSILTIVYFKYKNKEDKHVIPQMFEEVNSTKAEQKSRVLKRTLFLSMKFKLKVKITFVNILTKC